jgi:hypothetical protein
VEIIMADRGPSLGITVPGLLTTLLAVAFIGLGGWHAYPALVGIESPTLSVLISNEERAVDHLKGIQTAQDAFKRRHPRGEYARFVAHLWQWVDPRGNPMRFNLVSRQMAMAMDATKAVDGYYFVAVRSRSASDGTQIQLNYQSQWAVAALPAAFLKTGRLVFLADQTGSIYAQAPPRPPTRYPDQPTANKWFQLASRADLRNLQAGLEK